MSEIPEWMISLLSGREVQGKASKEENVKARGILLTGESWLGDQRDSGPYGDIVKAGRVALRGSCESSGSLASVGNNVYFVSFLGGLACS